MVGSVSNSNSITLGVRVASFTTPNAKSTRGLSFYLPLSPWRRRYQITSHIYFTIPCLMQFENHISLMFLFAAQIFSLLPMEQLSDISILQFQLLIQVPLYIISLLLYIIITSLKIILCASCSCFCRFRSINSRFQ